ncbi:DMT family transporter [Mitsuaria sp. WAJ17]|uniref:DMT family transporter n=1 Tax=Mitsuaria sp. WAJ17 TaxID=2761452 RepID=UPI0015FEEF79|nr:DMT family transporter [Mitsuaria sp. WAJ17]MBB2486440.1 DMT family transporter [Mitsuaria sp. WAJ17]
MQDHAQLDVAELTLLAAIWGASFLFLRLGAPAFGPLALAFVRVAGAGLFLLPLLAWQGGREGLLELRRDWRPLMLVALLNSALPFAFFSYAALSITAGLSSILNATTPIWGALVASIWLGQRLDPGRRLGLLVGFGGVVFLAWEHASFKPGGSGWAVLACLAATCCYGLAASATKKYLGQTRPLAVATGSQAFAALLLALPAAAQWPAQMPGQTAWLSALALALLCSGLAYILYFRLMKRAGPSYALSVTFLIPVFAVLWGAVFLGESFTLHMAAGCAIVLLGTALAIGVLKLPQRQAA